MKKPGVKALVVYKKKLLLILRDDDPTIPSPNTWNLPGGGIDDQESEEEAIRRELKEEIAIIPKNITYQAKQIFTDGSEVYRYVAFLTDEEYLHIHLRDEGQRLDFFTVDEITTLELAAYSKEFFSDYKDTIKEIVENYIL